MNKIQSFRFPNGERYGLLVNGLGEPLIYQNLYTTIHHRNKSDSINTIRAVYVILGFFAELCEFLEINIEGRFQTGYLLTHSEIESIALWAKKPRVELSKVVKGNKGQNVLPVNLKKIELARYTVVIDEDLVAANTTYNRLTVIAKYVTWLANTISSASHESISRMNHRIIHHRPVKMSPSDNEAFKSLDKDQKMRLLAMIEPNSKNNPWKGEAVRFRNRLIIHILMYVGCRKGEVLSLKATDLDPGKKQICIRRDADNPDDPRTSPALVKTLSRDVGVSDDLYSMIEQYIIQYRSKVKGANKCPYLLVSHQSVTSIAMPLSHSAVDKIFRELSRILGFSVHPHALRHTWNDDFSQLVEPLLRSGEISESESEDTRSQAMGWREGSGTAKTYTKRYQQQKAMKVGLQLQKKVRVDDIDRIDINHMDS